MEIIIVVLSGLRASVVRMNLIHPKSELPPARLTRSFIHPILESYVKLRMGVRGARNLIQKGNC